MAVMRSSKMILEIHLQVIYLGAALICQMQMMPFADWIDFVRVLVFLSGSAVFVLKRNSVTETHSVIMMNSVTVTNSVTAALPMIVTDFVKSCYLVQEKYEHLVSTNIVLTFLCKLVMRIKKCTSYNLVIGMTI